MFFRKKKNKDPIKSIDKFIIINNKRYIFNIKLNRHNIELNIFNKDGDLEKFIDVLTKEYGEVLVRHLFVEKVNDVIKDIIEDTLSSLSSYIIYEGLKIKIVISGNEDVTNKWLSMKINFVVIKIMFELATLIEVIEQRSIDFKDRTEELFDYSMETFELVFNDVRKQYIGG